MFRPLLCFVLLGSIAALQADEMVRSTQEELRRRNIYFGDIDGRPSQELEQALTRYQRRKGLTTSGKEDRETLRSLGLATRATGEAPPKELQWPEEPILKSDTRIDVAAETEELARDTGVSPASVTPPVANKPSPNLTTAARPARTASAAGGRPSPGGTRMAQQAPKQSQAEVRAFVEGYLKAVSRNSLEDELHFYADKVDYLGNGVVDRRIVERTLGKYYKRWPKRTYTLGSAMKYDFRPSRGEIVVTFRVEFSLKNDRSQVRGQTDNEVIINAATADPRILSIRERRVRS